MRQLPRINGGGVMLMVCDRSAMRSHFSHEHRFTSHHLLLETIASGITSVRS